MILSDIVNNKLEVPNNDSSCTVLMSHLLMDFSACAQASNVISTENKEDIYDISLRDLWKLKENPCISLSNLRTDNGEICYQELKVLESKTHHLVNLDMFNGVCSIDGLKVLAKKVQNVHFYCSTSPVATSNRPQSNTANATKMVISIKDAATNMKSDLIAGLSVHVDSSIGTGNSDSGSAPLAIAVTYSVRALPCSAAPTALSERDMSALVACGLVHSDLASMFAKDMEPGGTAPLLPPVFVDAGGMHSTLHQEVLTALLRGGANLSRVVLTQCVVSPATVDYWHALLCAYPCLLCVDNFGYSSTFSPISGPASPSDHEMLTAVCELCSRGHTERIVLSLGIFCKLQLGVFGGHGYGYLDRVLRPQLVSMCAQQQQDGEATARLITGGNLMRLLAWRRPLKEVQREVETLPCHVCSGKFVPGEHYSKHQFVYCSSKCLAAHRKLDWK